MPRSRHRQPATAQHIVQLFRQVGCDHQAFNRAQPGALNNLQPLKDKFVPLGSSVEEFAASVEKLATRRVGKHLGSRGKPQGDLSEVHSFGVGIASLKLF